MGQAEHQAEHGEKQRLFVGVPVPEMLLGFVSQAQAALPPVQGLRLMHAGQLHVTLAFIGEVDDEKASAARAVVEALPVDGGGMAEMTGFLMLPAPRKARVVALDLDDTSHVFARLFERVMGGLEVAGVMTRDKRPFRPHLTIARLRVPGAVQPRFESGRAAYEVESVCLYRSELSRESARYTVLARSAFGQECG
jgi:RNA 2',3'-cyclic 3'-phosphodiesterase